MAGAQETGEKAIGGRNNYFSSSPATSSTSTSTSTSASTSTDGEFLLHLLCKGSKQTSEDDSNKSSLSLYSGEEPWQLTDPAVAALGPSHPFHNPPLQNPNVFFNRDYPHPHPHLDPHSHPHLDPHSHHHLNPYPFRNPYEKQPMGSPFAHLYGSAAAAANGHFGIQPHLPHWIEGGRCPYGHMPPCEGVEIHRPTFSWQMQNHSQRSHLSGSGSDPLGHLRGLSESPKEGLRLPLGGFGELRANGGLHNNNENSVGGNFSARDLNENRNFVSRNGGSQIPSWPPVAKEQLISRDRELQFGSVAWHSEYSKVNQMNSIQLRDKNKFELNSGDIFLDKSELPLNLQGNNGVVRILCRPSSNQQGCGNPTATEEGAKAQVGANPRVSKGPVASFEQRILKGKAEVRRGRRHIVRKETTVFAPNNTHYRDGRSKESDKQCSLEIERDSNQNNVSCNEHAQLEVMQNDGIRNGAANSGITEVRHTKGLAKEFTRTNTNRDVMENHHLQSGDGDVFRRCGESQHEWRVKQSQDHGPMQSGNLNSFSTITGYLSALDVNGCDIYNFNDGLEKHLPSRLCKPDDASSSQLLAFQPENPCPSSVQSLESEQYYKELPEIAILEGNQTSAAERRRPGKQRADLNRRKSEEVHKEDTGADFRENSNHLKPLSDRDRYRNRNNSAFPRVYKDVESDTREGTLMAKQYRRHEIMKIRRKEFQYRVDLEILTPRFLSLYESLIPREEEEVKRKQLLSSLEKIINRHWPGARLHLFGSCANAFGVSKSDIDVCLSIDDKPCSKSKLVLKLAEILKAEYMENVQALTHARVPIVKFTDPVTDISCDICINNILAIVNTKLLYDYAQIDVRLQQLAFIVKHWAKCRRINETYQGTLSSYAYVLMCINFLQQRKPAILPCLHEMEATYQVSIGEIECAYCDKVDELKHCGAENKETLGQLLSAFFDYWAFRHDYANSVISVRTGGLLSKNEKDWTRRIGNERHLICIEDPFEISHDLGRVVDKHSIRVLKEEFQRAAEIMLDDPDPCVTLFKPYMPS